jgi:hypothetical protein
MAAVFLSSCVSAGGSFDRGPDLVPEPRTGSQGPNGFCRGDNSNLIVKVRNQGTEPALVTTTTRIRFSPGGDQLATTPPLDDGSAADVTVPIPNGCFNPDCNFSITVDVDGQVEELKHNASDTSHEDNNTEQGTCIG